jgi:hypothetical protein
MLQNVHFFIPQDIQQVQSFIGDVFLVLRVLDISVSELEEAFHQTGYTEGWARVRLG